MGVRISWLMLARNSLLARLAASAASLARAGSPRPACCSVMSSRSPWNGGCRIPDGPHADAVIADISVHCGDCPVLKDLPPALDSAANAFATSFFGGSSAWNVINRGGEAPRGYGRVRPGRR